MATIDLANLSPTLAAGLLAALERMLNEALQLDAVSAEKLRQLKGRWLRIRATPLEQSVYLCADYPLRLSLELADQPDVTVSGSPMSLLRFWQQGEPGPNLHIAGDQSLAEGLAKVSSTLELDWESKLAELIGNLPAHFIGNRTREAQSWLHYAQQNFFQDAEEYLHHESRIIPDHEEVKLWKEDIIDLAATVTVLDNRIDKLEAARNRVSSSVGDGSASQYSSSCKANPANNPSGQ